MFTFNNLFLESSVNFKAIQGCLYGVVALVVILCIVLVSVKSAKAIINFFMPKEPSRCTFLANERKSIVLFINNPFVFF